MKLRYKSKLDEGLLILTNFNCYPSQQLLSDKGLYKIIWAKDSNRNLIIDGYKIVLTQGQMLFCSPLNSIEVAQSNGLLALVFNREFYCIREHDAEVSCNGFLFYDSSRPPIIDLSERDLKSFGALFLMIEEEFETQDQIQGEMLRVLLKRLLIKATRSIKAQMPNPNLPKKEFDLVRQFHILVEQHFKQQHQVSDYAEMLFKSPKTLSNYFKKVGNKSPLKVINERIVLEAKRLLLFSDKTAEEIAYELGFNDASHFSKFFKKSTGVPPGSFKNVKSSL